jgi:hypothetical protein
MDHFRAPVKHGSFPGFHHVSTGLCLPIVPGARVPLRPLPRARGRVQDRRCEWHRPGHCGQVGVAQSDRRAGRYVDALEEESVGDEREDLKPDANTEPAEVHASYAPPCLAEPRHARDREADEHGRGDRHRGDAQRPRSLARAAHGSARDLSQRGSCAVGDLADCDWRVASVERACRVADQEGESATPRTDGSLVATSWWASDSNCPAAWRTPAAAIGVLVLVGRRGRLAVSTVAINVLESARRERPLRSCWARSASSGELDGGTPSASRQSSASDPAHTRMRRPRAGPPRRTRGSSLMPVACPRARRSTDGPPGSSHAVIRAGLVARVGVAGRPGRPAVR